VEDAAAELPESLGCELGCGIGRVFRDGWGLVFACHIRGRCSVLVLIFEPFAVELGDSKWPSVDTVTYFND
jgi:hypothetical protein